jgi:hypothetical protein
MKIHLSDMSYFKAYVMRSGRNALIMQSFCSGVLFFHSWGNFSFSGHSDSTSFFQRLGEHSMSRSKFLQQVTSNRQNTRFIGIEEPKLYT